MNPKLKTLLDLSTLAHMQKKSTTPLYCATAAKNASTNVAWIFNKTLDNLH